MISLLYPCEVDIIRTVMILTRTPLRICLGGGGTDVREYFERFEGYVVSAAINRYIYVAIHRNIEKTIRVCYSKRELVDTADQVRHPVVREAFKIFEIEEGGFEILSFADIPSDTGLGSSSSFTVGLITALAAFKGIKMTRYEIAEMACHIERDLLREAGGKQDQYIAAFGGITCLIFQKDGRVLVCPVQISHDSIRALEENIIVFDTGIKRNSPKVQATLIRGVKKETRTLDSLHIIKNLGIATEEILRTGELDRYADFLKQHWAEKQRLSDAVTNGRINRLYEIAMKNGGMGAKLIGAGGGGYLLVYCSDAHKREQVKHAFQQEGLEQLYYGFDLGGTTVLVDDSATNKHLISV